MLENKFKDKWKNLNTINLYKVSGRVSVCLKGSSKKYSFHI